MTVKQILYSLQNCSLGQSAARAPTPATPHHPQFPHKMRRRHLESVSVAPYGSTFQHLLKSPIRIQPQLSEKGVLGHSPKCVLVWGPRRVARPAGERRSGGALEGCLIATRHGANPATTRTSKRNAPAASRTGFASGKINAPPLGDHKFGPKILYYFPS